tara:strand:+ start:30715 stop:30897 length:183 start_codon:yes stop_codon:yes gene_type:complete
MMSSVIITIIPSIISIDPPGGWGGGGELPLAIDKGLRIEGMKVRLYFYQDARIMHLEARV